MGLTVTTYVGSSMATLSFLFQKHSPLQKISEQTLTDSLQATVDKTLEIQIGLQTAGQNLHHPPKHVLSGHSGHPSGIFSPATTPPRPASRHTPAKEVGTNGNVLPFIIPGPK